MCLSEIFPAQHFNIASASSAEEFTTSQLRSISAVLTSVVEAGEEALDAFAEDGYEELWQLPFIGGDDDISRLEAALAIVGWC